MFFVTQLFHLLCCSNTHHPPPYSIVSSSYKMHWNSVIDLRCTDAQLLEHSNINMVEITDIQLHDVNMSYLETNIRIDLQM